MSFENPFTGQGRVSFERSGLTPQERATEKSQGSLSFKEKVERLRTGAKEIVSGERYAPLIRDILRKQKESQYITEDDCEEFCKTHPDFPFEPEMVRSIAEEIERKDRQNN